MENTAAGKVYGKFGAPASRRRSGGATAAPLRGIPLSQGFYDASLSAMKLEK